MALRSLAFPIRVGTQARCLRPDVALLGWFGYRRAMALTDIPDKLKTISDRSIVFTVLKLLRLEVEARLAAIEAGTSNTGVIKYRTVTIARSELTGLSAGVKTFSKNLGSGAMPSGARLIGVSYGESFTGLTDGATATYTLKLGSTSDDDAITSTVNVASGQTGFPKAGTAGVRGYANAPMYAEQPALILTSDADLNTASAGSVTCTLAYFVPVSG